MGILVCADCPLDLKEDPLKEAFARAGVACDERTHQMFLDYYDKMKEPQGLYMANLGVDPEYRRRGIAKAMMEYVMQEKDYCHLECVKSNFAAWNGYLKLGFEIAFEYLGVCDVPCYKMIYRRDK